MEIQTQASTSSAAAALAGTSTTNGNGTKGVSTTSAGDQTAGGFSAALNQLIAELPAGNTGNASAALPVLPVLTQLVAAGASPAAEAPQDSNKEAILKQLDALIELLDSKDPKAEQLLENPDVQAWLVQLQASLLVQRTTSVAPNQQAADSADNIAEVAVDQKSVLGADSKEQINTLNPLLFVPLNSDPIEESSMQTTQMASLKPVSKEEALDLLNKFKQEVEKEDSTPSVKNLQRSLTALFKVQQQPMEQKLISTESALPVNAAPVVRPQLEILAAKTLVPRLDTETVHKETPLFEPLMDSQSSSSDSPAMPLHEYLKQIPNGTHIAKTPVLMANAPTLAEDVTQLVLKSFSMNVLAEGITEAKLSLYPQHLGQVDVKLTMQNGQLVAQFMAESMAGKEMLEGQLSQLRSTLQSQGIQVEKLEVTQNQAFQSGMFQDQRQQQQSQQSSKQSKGNNANKVLSIDEEWAQAETVRSQVSSGVRQTSIDTTA